MSTYFRKELFSTGALYRKFMNPILSKDEGIDAEILSQISLKIIENISLYRNLPGLSSILNKISMELQVKDSKLEQNIFGCKFINPVGLAAGFDKNAVGAGIWDCFGFGFAELGTITLHKQLGNPKPRLFRLSKEQAALNRMGFNNNGAKNILKSLILQRLPEKSNRKIILGLNFGKLKRTSLSNAPDEYAESIQILGDLADYIVVNISSPNTPGLRELQNINQLDILIKRLKQIDKCPPILIKIAPDLKDNQIDEIANFAYSEKLAGIIAVNTSINRLGLENRIIIQSGKTLNEESGGLSGSPLNKRALEVSRRIHNVTGKNLPLIGVGGIDSPKSAWERITAGCSLLQIYTGWIYKGPDLVPQILNSLLSQLDKHGFNNIAEAVGSEAPWI